MKRTILFFSTAMLLGGGLLARAGSSAPAGQPSGDESAPVAAQGAADERSDSMEIQRISPKDAKSLQDEGKALLVCGYDDEEKCEGMRIKGALTLQEFERKLPDLGKDVTLVFYCG